MAQLSGEQFLACMEQASVWKPGEIDFLIGNIVNDKTYEIEVKAGKAIGKTAQMLLNDGKVEAVYFLKGDTYGGITDRKITAPIYLVGRVRFDLKKEERERLNG